MEKKILDLACGNNKRVGSFGVDCIQSVNKNVDLIHNLDSFPWPLQENFFDEIYIIDSLFLLEDPVKVFDEIYRIGKKNSAVHVRQPYFRSVYNFIDPYVKNFGTYQSLDFYDQRTHVAKTYNYSKVNFKILNISFNKNIENSLATKLLILFANKYSFYYKRYLSWFFPLSLISWELRNEKN